MKVVLSVDYHELPQNAGTSLDYFCSYGRGLDRSVGALPSQSLGSGALAGPDAMTCNSTCPAWMVSPFCLQM
jgi:hypothetical protein